MHCEHVKCYSVNSATVYDSVIESEMQFMHYSMEAEIVWLHFLLMKNISVS